MLVLDSVDITNLPQLQHDHLTVDSTMMIFGVWLPICSGNFFSHKFWTSVAAEFFRYTKCWKV